MSSGAGGAWQEAWDSTRQVPYYYNPRTRERRWRKPPDGEDLPVGWASAWDARRQRPYYYNSKTRETRWSRPSESDAAQLTLNPVAAQAPAVPRLPHTFDAELPNNSARALKDGGASAAQALKPASRPTEGEEDPGVVGAGGAMWRSARHCWNIVP